MACLLPLSWAKMDIARPGIAASSFSLTRFAAAVCVKSFVEQASPSPETDTF
jgi:hypothetical protein